MKKLALVFVLFLTVTVAFGQNKWQQQQINQFVDAAAKEFNFSADQKQELLTLRTNLIKNYSEVNIQEGQGQISTEDKQEKFKEFNKEFQAGLIKLTGKTYKELEPFLSRMREELKAKK